MHTQKSRGRFARSTWTALVSLYVAVTVVAVAGAGFSLTAHPTANSAVSGAEVVQPDHGANSGDIVPLTRYEAVIPLGRRAIHLPIIEYHYIRVVTDKRDLLGFNLSVTPANFKAQMDWLATRGYNPVTFDDVRAYFQGKRPLPSKPVVLTFDDGYQNFWDVAEPILLQDGFKAVAYIVPGFWGKGFYMSPTEVLDLDRSGMVEIASHTVDHANLARSSPAMRSYELSASKRMLEQLLGHPVVDFCYPSGKFNAEAVNAVGLAGYATATTEMPGTELAWGTRLIWPRVRAYGGESLAAFVADLGQSEPTAQVQVAYVPTRGPAVVGPV